MNLFFGKISQKFDTTQLVDGYYQASRNSSWFGELEIGDYVYMIGGSKVQFWQAKEWIEVDGCDRLTFKILSDDLGINTQGLISLKFLKVTKALAVLTSRSAKNRAFFPITLLDKSLAIAYLSDPNTYKNKEIYRKVRVLTNKLSLEENSKDIQLYLDQGKLNVHSASFIDESILREFRDNRNYIGKGQKQKDNTLQRVDEALKNNESAVLSFERTIYDAFFCEYKIDGNTIEIDGVEVEQEEELEDTEIKLPLNQILYGPPGTGKTYDTINKALKIINGEVPSKREKAKQKFDELVASGQIVFTTFHQSMSYEDFVEGIKPTVEDGQINYEVRDGIFKSLCGTAKVLKSTINNFDWEGRNFFKMSSGGKENIPLHEWSLKNNKIALGYGGSNDLSRFRSIRDWKEYQNKFEETFPSLMEDTSYHRLATWKFIKLQIGDIIVLTKGNYIIDAIGVVKSEYQYEEDEYGYPHRRNVEWIVKDFNASPSKFLNKNVSQQTIYEFNQEDIKLDAFRELTTTEEVEPQNYVLIIDEINRGNVSSIFGELITLIEDSKRLGNDEALEVTLPYSKERFGVPNNLYIIGTMNTADRSVEALDTALRRRFVFEEMMPNYDLLDEYYLEIDTEEFLLSEILETINKRIKVLLDRDHQIGHSYFLKVEDEESLKLSFAKEIIPLLQEYFYGDYQKIALVLGLGFFEKIEEIESNVFADITDFDADVFTGQKQYELKNPLDMKTDEFVRALNLLLNNK